jgi:ubiquinone/menaquinone biosynthesis C-methylase UbiE
MAFSDPQKIVEQLHVADGTVVADLGTGTGFYALAVAHAVGEHGKVYAVEIQQGLLTRLKTAAHAQKLKNIEYVHGDVETLGGSRIKEHSIDVAIAANILFQVEDREQFIQEIKRILKPGGQVLVVDWTDSFNGLGPLPDMVVTQQDAKTMFEQQGFNFVSPVIAGDHHYGLIFRNQ